MQPYLNDSKQSKIYILNNQNSAYMTVELEHIHYFSDIIVLTIGITGAASRKPKPRMIGG